MRTSRGLTIIEALIAIAVIGVVFVSLASVQITSLRVTSDARTDSDLLQVAVTTFEDARTIVLANFETIFATCPERGSCATELLAGLAVKKSNYEVKHVLAQRAGGYVTGGEAGAGVYAVFPGLLELEVSVGDTRGRELLFKQYVSCLDANDLPTLSDPSVCEGP